MTDGKPSRQAPATGRDAGIWACMLGMLAACAGSTSAAGERDLKSLGLEYRLLELKEPRPNRVHVLRVDLGKGRLQPVVVIAADPDGDGPAEAALTDPLKLAADRTVVAFVNTNPWDGLPDSRGTKNRSWFEGQPVDILGLAVSAGQRPRSPAGPGTASVWFDGRGRVGTGDGPAAGPVAEGLAGFQRVVAGGALVVPQGGPLHPRTALGANRGGSLVWLVVVDGRQEGFSEGMSLRELGQVMLDVGCWDATNLDGGGSSIMGLAGEAGRLRVVNSPSDRRLGKPKSRPLPTILTIQEKPDPSQPPVNEIGSKE